MAEEKQNLVPVGGRTLLNIPHAISEETQEFLRALNNPALTRGLPGADDIEGWGRLQELVERWAISQSDMLVERFAPAFAGFALGDVPVLDVRPRNWKEKSKVGIYTHGGGFALYSAASTLGRAALFADETDLRVISVDYTLVPRATFEEIRNQVVAVVRALLHEGYRLEDTIMFGDSSGGALTVAVILELHNLGLGLPAGAVLVSPCIRLMSGEAGGMAREASAPGTGKRPVCEIPISTNARTMKSVGSTLIDADFSKGFSPTLIQGSTGDVLVSEFFRLYHVLDLARAPVKLDLYEGVKQGFLFRDPDAPESKIARRKMRQFVRLRLASRAEADRNGRATLEISKVSRKETGEADATSGF